MSADLETGREVFQKILTNVETVIHGQRSTLRLLLSAFESGGHVLLEDYPGTGKTTLAKFLAKSIDASFKRIQFTPDLLPSDILGVSVFDQKNQSFRFMAGPVLPTYCWPMKSTGLHRGPSRRCSRRWGRGRSAWKEIARNWRIFSLCWPRKTPLNSGERIRCRKRRWTVSRCRSVSVM